MFVLPEVENARAPLQSAIPCYTHMQKTCIYDVCV